MEALIPVINKLQEVFATIGYRECEVQLPQIVVVGSQSAGKSSVIEGIVGRDFLPRGNGIVTRRPLLLHLIHVPLKDRSETNGSKTSDWAIFEHKKDKIFLDFDKVRQEIEDETTRLTGNNKGISPVPIILKIYSHRVLNLSLIDLPGITKVPVGDQPIDIEVQIRHMICNYISNPNSIILAVTPANQDFTTSEPLKLAKDVDKEGKRTLAVLTKLDLMDNGTDAMDVLTGKLVPVKLGIIGVVNRSQADINAKKSIMQCLDDESKFLHSKYTTLASINGTQYLSKTLNKLLLLHIRECLPKLKVRLNTMSLQCENQLRSYGEPILDKRGALLQIITRFSDSYTSTIEGTSKSDIETSYLCGGARICYIFHEMFSSNLQKLDPMECLSSNEILVAIRNATGPRPVLFIPEASFELLAKRQIRRLEHPSLHCVDMVYEELLSIVQHCGFDIQQEMQRFPHLYKRINDVVSNVLSTRLVPTKEFVSNLIGIELAYINSRHPEFMDAALSSLMTESGFVQPSLISNGANCAAPSPVASSVDLDAMGAENGKADVDLKTSSNIRTNGRSFISFRKKAKSNGVHFTANDSSDQMPPVAENPTLIDNNNSVNSGKSGGWWFRSNNNSIPQPQSVDIDHFQIQNTSAALLTNQMATSNSVSKAKFYENLQQTKGLSSREIRDCAVIEKLIRNYFVIVRKSIQDMVPKSIMKFMVNYMKENLQGELVRRLYNCADLEEILSESDLMSQRRKETAEMLTALNKAKSVICEIREANIW